MTDQPVPSVAPGAAGTSLAEQQQALLASLSAASWLALVEQRETERADILDAFADQIVGGWVEDSSVRRANAKLARVVSELPPELREDVAVQSVSLDAGPA